MFWAERFGRTLRNRPFRWLLLVLIAIPPLAGWWLVTIQAPVSNGIADQVDGHVYLRAAQAIAAGHSPYAGFNARWSSFQGAYIYPPLLAWLLQPLTRLPVRQADLVLVAGGQALLLATYAATLAAFRVRTPWRAFVYLLLFFGFAPTWEDLYLLQANTLLALCAALWVLAWARGRAAGGLGAGIGIAVKLLPAPLLALPLLRRRWGDLALAGLTTAALWAMAAPAYLPDYLLRVLPSIGRGGASVANIAPSGVIAWLIDPASFYTSAETINRVPALSAAAIGVAVLAVTIWRLRRPAEDETRRATEAAAWVAALPLLSSLVYPNYGLIVMVAVIGCLEVAWRRRDAAPALLAAAFWLLLGPGHLLYVHALLEHRADPSIGAAITLDRVQGGWDVALRIWSLAGPLALVSLWVGSLRAARPSMPLRRAVNAPSSTLRVDTSPTGGEEAYSV